MVHYVNFMSRGYKDATELRPSSFPQSVFPIVEYGDTGIY
jgi:hypothetical protein